MRDVAFSCDNNGVPFLKVAVGSLLKHYRGAEPLRINVFEGYGGHSAASKAELQTIVEAANARREGVRRETRDAKGRETGDAKGRETGDAKGRETGDANSNNRTIEQSNNLFSLRYVNVEATLKPYEDAILHRDNSRWNVFTWTPVFTPELIPDATGNVIHFDIDMLFNADVSELFALDLSGVSSVDAVSSPRQKADGSVLIGRDGDIASTGRDGDIASTGRDGDIASTGRDGDIASTGRGETPRLPAYLIACTYEYDRYGDNAGRVIWEKGILPPSVERYFNTGVLVFNAEACRAERTWEKIVGWYRAHYDIADRIEQDAWNALYWDRMRPLDVAWNFHDRAMKNYAKWNLRDKYWLGNPPADCLRAALAPKLLHFWGPKKPWKVSHRPYRKLYHAAMRDVGQTPPREPLLAPWHDLVNALTRRRLGRRLAELDLANANEGERK